MIQISKYPSENPIPGLILRHTVPLFRLKEIADLFIKLFVYIVINVSLIQLLINDLIRSKELINK